MGCIYSKVLPKNSRDNVRKRKTKRKRGHVSSEARKEQTSEEILHQLADLGIVKNTKSASGGVAFDIGNTGLPDKPPRRLEKLEHTPRLSGIQYTADQKGMMADILKINDAKEKAWELEKKLDKAKRRRMFKEAERKNKLEERKLAKEERMEKHAEKIGKIAKKV